MQRQFSAKKKWWIFFGVMFVVILTLVFILPNMRSQTTILKSNGANLKPSVDIQTVQRKDMTRRITLAGQTVPEAQVDIAAKYSGRITLVNVSLGQAVKAGDILIIQDTGDIDLSISQTDASRRQAEAEAAETQAAYFAKYQKVKSEYQRSLKNYERYKALYSTGAVSRESLDTIEQQMINAKSELETLDNQYLYGVGPALLESKRAALEKVERNVDALEKQREDLILRAPRSGVIGYRQAEIGALVQSGQKLLSIVDNSGIYIDCQMSEKDIAHISLGMTADVQVESLGNNYIGKIIYVSPASDAKSQNYIVRISLDKPDSLLRSGMFARTQLEVLQRPQTLFVSKEAIIEKNGKRYVFIINVDNKAEERSVTLGLSNDKVVEILSGVSEGERVAISNLARLRNGMSVDIIPAEDIRVNSDNQGGR
ncbi:efflux RND transporter periplasmic adaptor subunit [Dendrosporobacter sp. 1207_IL3150]|uniref:efflux RND transporter periplasmic adaptor subunit n=1 Tax=Dendrosporobacter sp. 1207_IL3150 TaxID=3084054 RepID=UPI002FD8E7B4